MDYYYTYKITFVNDDYYYLGKHKTPNLNDGYSGSGKKLKGRTDPFTFDILEYYNSEKELNIAERDLIGDKWFTDPMCLNMKPGGTGGWTAVNLTLDRSYMQTDEYKRKMSKTIKRLHTEGKLKTFADMPEVSALGRMKIDELYPNGTFYGRTHTEETKKRIGATNSKHQTGKGNSQYGTMWITDGTNNQKIKKTEPIPEGWTKGRKLKVAN